MNKHPAKCLCRHTIEHHPIDKSKVFTDKNGNKYYKFGRCTYKECHNNCRGWEEDMRNKKPVQHE